MKIEKLIIRQCDVGRTCHIVTEIHFWTPALIRNLNKFLSQWDWFFKKCA